MKITVKIAILILIPLWITACKTEKTSVKNEPAVKLTSVNLHLGPVLTFETSCKTCHQEKDASFPEKIAKLEQNQLEKKVQDMMQGPASLVPTDDEVKAMIAYHYAIRDNIPFVCIKNGLAVQKKETQELMGEATPGTKISIQKDQQIVNAESKEGKWVIPNTPEPPFTVIVETNQSKNSFTFPEAQWCNTTITN